MNSAPTNALNAIKAKSCFVLDLDGVVYLGSEAVPGVIATIKYLQNLGKKILYLTNNSGKSSSAILNKLRKLQIECLPEDVVTSGEAAAHFIKRKALDRNGGIFVVGTADLRRELTNIGIALAEPENCGAVLVGYDPNFSYQTITEALQALRRNVPLIVCNRDPHFPVENGKLMPGCGAMVGAIEGACGVSATFEVGKPNTIMLEFLLARHQIANSECVAFGDGLNSDILMANRAEIPSVLLTNGDAASVPQDNTGRAKPDATYTSLFHFVQETFNVDPSCNFPYSSLPTTEQTT